MSRSADVVFLIDGTESMKPCMNAIKEHISIFFDNCDDPQNSVNDWRGKVVTYRNQKTDGSQWFEDNDFISNDKEALKVQLNKLEAGGGDDDEPESALDAIHKLATMPVSPDDAQELSSGSWRKNAAKVIILFTDATYHPNMTYKEGEGGNINDVANAIHANSIILVFYAPDHDLWEEVFSMDRAEWHYIEGPDFARGLRDYISEDDTTTTIQTIVQTLISRGCCAI